MLAPVLARLQSCPGVDRACVDLTGQYFLIMANADLITAGVLQELGAGACAVVSPAKELQIEMFRAGEVWLDCGSIERISMLEARILATKWGGTAAREAGIPVEVAVRVASVLQRELNREFARVHRQGGTSVRNWYKSAFPGAFRRVAADLRSFLDQREVKKIASSLDNSLKSTPATNFTRSSG